MPKYRLRRVRALADADGHRATLARLCVATRRQPTRPQVRRVDVRRLAALLHALVLVLGTANARVIETSSAEYRLLHAREATAQRRTGTAASRLDRRSDFSAAF